MGTKKILNKDVSNVVEESLAGYLMAYRKYYKKVGEYNAFTYKGHRKDKVALVIGGGSGHEPLFTGYCGAGLADAVACGNVCASPNPELIMEAAKAVDQGKGVLFVYGNYAGDALAANADKGLLEMLKAAEASAKQGVEDTKKYVAKFGRAKSLLERAIGHQDAGATSVYLIFQGMREFVEGKLA